MTSARETVWESTQLWLDDLCGEPDTAHAEPGHPEPGNLEPGNLEPAVAEPPGTEPPGTEPDQEPRPDGDLPPPVEADVARHSPQAPAATPTDPAAPVESDSTTTQSVTDGGYDGESPSRATGFGEPRGEDYGRWWDQEPPGDRYVYAGLADLEFTPIDLDHPPGEDAVTAGRRNGRRRGRRGPGPRAGHDAGRTATLPDPAGDSAEDSAGDGFDSAEDAAWLSSASPPAAPPVPSVAGAAAPAGTVSGGAEAAEAPPRFNKGLVVGFGAVVVVGTIVVTSMLLSMRRDPAPETALGAVSETQVSVVAAPPPPPVEADGTDSPIPFVATADCPAGSTPAQSVAGDDPTRAWVCVRGGVDGQVLTLDLGRTMVVTAVSITPGWVGTDTNGADPWLSHRVVAKVQWVFDGDPATVMTQTTGNIRGEAVQPVPGRGVLASRITMIVRQTARPPADVAPTTGVPGSGMPGEVLPPAGGPLAPPGGTETFTLPGFPGSTTDNDPVDATFAVSAIKILGHPPM